MFDDDMNSYCSQINDYLFWLWMIFLAILKFLFCPYVLPSKIALLVNYLQLFKYTYFCVVSKNKGSEFNPMWQGV